MDKEKIERLLKIVDNHRYDVLEFFGVDSVSDVANFSNGKIYRASFMPAFNADCCITIRVSNDGRADLLVNTSDHNLWYARFKNILVESYDKRKTIPNELWNKFHEEMVALKPLSLVNDDTIGYDGMTIHCECFEAPEKINIFKTWTPSKDEKPCYFRFVNAILQLARKLFPENPFRENLFTIYQSLVGSFDAWICSNNDSYYLGVSPHLVLNGCVKEIFYDDFSNLLNKIPIDVPVLVSVERPWQGIVDRNLVSLLKKFMGRAGLTIWQNSFIEDKQKLLDIGIPESQIFGSRRQAIKKIRNDKNFENTFDVFHCTPKHHLLYLEVSPHIIFNGKIAFQFKKHLREFLHLFANPKALIQIRNAWLGIVEDELIPIIREYAKSFQDTVWLLDGEGKQRLVDMGVRESSIFYSTKKAINAFKKRQLESNEQLG